MESPGITFHELKVFFLLVGGKLAAPGGGGNSSLPAPPVLWASRRKHGQFQLLAGIHTVHYAFPCFLNSTHAKQNSNRGKFITTVWTSKSSEHHNAPCRPPIITY